jgi:hypothetical protein
MKYDFRESPMLRVILSLFCAASLFASNGGNLAGTVADPTGAAIPAVTVIVRNTDTGAAQQTQSEPDGSYAFSDLPAGRYTIRAEHAGFNPFAKPALVIEGGSRVRIDIAMTLEAHSDTVTVTESLNQVQTVDTQTGSTLNATKMASIPVNGRSFTDLLALQPGVIPASSAQPNAVVMAGCTNAPPSGDLDPGNLSVSGQRETANGFSVNGASAQEDFNMGAAIVPNLDSIQDLRVLTGNFNAEYGNFSGGQILVATRSGANQLHGSVFEYLRNTALDARNYFALGRAEYLRNQFGGAFGGPIRKDKLFYFTDYQGTRMTQGVDTGLISVPSLQDRAGNFSDIASSLTGAVSGPYFANLLTQKLGYRVSAGTLLRRDLRHFRPMRVSRRADPAERLVRASQVAASLHPRAKSRRQCLFHGGAKRESPRRQRRHTHRLRHARRFSRGILLCRRLRPQQSLSLVARRSKCPRLQCPLHGPCAARHPLTHHHVRPCLCK